MCDKCLKKKRLVLASHVTIAWCALIRMTPLIVSLLSLSTDEPTSSSFVKDLVAPNTFFVQLVRLSISLCFVTILFFVYNSVRVLERPIISTATCSLYWVVFFSFAALK